MQHFHNNIFFSNEALLTDANDPLPIKENTSLVKILNLSHVLANMLKLMLKIADLHLSQCGTRHKFFLSCTLGAIQKVRRSPRGWLDKKVPKSDVAHQHFFLMTIFPFSDILNTVLLTLKKHIQHSGGGVSEIALLLFEAITSAQALVKRAELKFSREQFAGGQFTG